MKEGEGGRISQRGREEAREGRKGERRRERGRMETDPGAFPYRFPAAKMNSGKAG